MSAWRAIQTPSGIGHHGGQQDRRDRQGDRVRQPAQHHVERGRLERVRRAQIELQQHPEVAAGTGRTPTGRGPCRCGSWRGPRWSPAGPPSHTRDRRVPCRISTKTVVSVRNTVSSTLAEAFCDVARHGQRGVRSCRRAQRGAADAARVRRVAVSSVTDRPVSYRDRRAAESSRPSSVTQLTMTFLRDSRKYDFVLRIACSSAYAVHCVASQSPVSARDRHPASALTNSSRGR